LPLQRESIMTGKYFEELEVGMQFAHQPARTVTETDNLLFTALTHNPQPLHLDAEFAGATQHGQILVNSIFTLGLVVGLSVGDTTLGSWRATGPAAYRSRRPHTRRPATA
jgi:acyl dehydratase